VIVVTVNYRLGILGFFSHPGLTAESPHHSSGNYGLLDQMAALKWVQENIAQFGGDPKAVTLFGESAGSVDSGMLLTSPLAANLFSRVIMESGPPFGLGPIHTLQEAEATGARIGQAASGNSSSALENLRKLSTPELLRLATASSGGPYDASPIVDGWVLTQPPARAFATGAIQKADLMIGLNGREMSAFRVVAAAYAKPAAKDSKGGGVREAVGKLADAARPLYGGWTNLAIAKYFVQAMMHRDEAIDQLSSDMLVACPIGAIAVLHNATGQRTFVYRFDRSVPGKGESDLGAFHSIELPYVFNSFQDPSWQWLPFTDADHRLAGAIEVYWTNFAKTGDPNGPGMQNWAAWQDGAENYLEFTRNAAAFALRDFAPPFCYLSPSRLHKELDGGIVELHAVRRGE
jgi:para-nitrobenzyl esterase